MVTVSYSEFRDHPDKYLEAVERGETLELSKEGKPVAILSPAAEHGREFARRAMLPNIEVEAAAAEPPRAHDTLARGSGNGDVDLPHLCLGEYQGLSLGERDRLQTEAYERNWDWIERKLAELGADWMVVVHGEVRQWSADLQKYPTDEQLVQLAEEEGEVPFVFIRSPLVEECAWAALPGGDYYPTVELQVAGHRLTADLDTGSPHTILNEEWLSGLGLVPPPAVSPSHVRAHLGSPYRCRLLPIPLTLVSEDGRRSDLSLFCLSVLDWRRSPWCSTLINPHREALAGRDLFRAFGLIAELDGRARTTRVRLPEQPTEA